MIKIALHSVPGFMLLAVLILALRIMGGGSGQQSRGTAIGERSITHEDANKDPLDDLYSDNYRKKAAEKPGEAQAVAAAGATAEAAPPTAAAVLTAPAALDLRCKQNDLVACNAIGAFFMDRWDLLPASRASAEDAYANSCSHGSKIGCRELRAIATKFTDDTTAQLRVIYRVCDIGDPEGCDAGFTLYANGMKAGQFAEQGAREAYSYLVRLCHAAFPEPAGLCDKRRAGLKRLLEGKLEHVDPAVVATITREMADEERSGRYLTPEATRRDWQRDE